MRSMNAMSCIASGSGWKRWPRLHVVLEDLDGRLVVELNARHLVEGDDVPQSDQAHLAAGHVVEEVGDGGAAPGHEDRVGRYLTVHEGLPRAARPQLDVVEVVFDHRDQATQEQKLGAGAELGWLEPNGAEEQVPPFVGGELAPPLLPLVQLEARQLDRPDLGDVEGAIVVLFVRAIFQLHLRPDPSFEQPRIPPYQVVGHVEIAVAEVGHLSPVPAFQRPHPYLVDHHQLPAVLEGELRSVRLVGTNEVLRDGVVDQPESGIYGSLVICRAVLAQQVLQHVDGHVGPHLDLAHQVLADHTAGKHLRDPPVEHLRSGLLPHSRISSGMGPTRASSVPVPASTSRTVAFPCWTSPSIMSAIVFDSTTRSSPATSRSCTSPVASSNP